MFKKKVGRPSNAYKKRVRNFRLFSVVLIGGVIVSSMLGISNYVDKLGADVNSVPSGSIIKDYRLHKCAAESLNTSSSRALTQEQLEKITTLSCEFDRADTTKLSFEGIEKMKSLETISFMIDDKDGKSLNILSNVDLSKNKSLENVTFNGYNFGVKTIKVPASLTDLTVYIENVSNIDLRNNKKLKSLYVNSSKDIDIKKIKLPNVDYAYYVHNNDNKKAASIVVPSNSCVKPYDGNNAVHVGFNYISLKSANVGTYTVKITPIDDYKWKDGSKKTKKITCKIEKVNIKGYTLKSINSKKYTGKKIEPSVTTSLGSSKLKKGKDYTVTYKNNINPGEATATVKGIGNYTGTVVLKFEIEGKESTKGNVEIQKENRSVRYSTKKCDSTPTTYELVDKSGAKITKVEFKVTFGESGSSYRNWTVLTKANNTCAETPSSRCKITMRDNHLRYDLRVTTSDGKIQLIKRLASCVKKSGTSSASKKSDDEEILKGFDDETDLKNSEINKIPNQSYTGKPITPSVTVKLDGKTLKKGTDYTVSYSNNTNKGTATVTVKGKGNYKGTKKTTFKIEGTILDDFEKYDNTDLKNATIDKISDQLYTGKPITPSVTVKLDGKTLKKGTDYTVSYSNNTNKGTATVTVTGKGSYKGTKKTTFKIEGTMIDDWEKVDDAKAKIEVVNRNRTLQDASCYTTPLTFTFRDTSSAVGIKEVQYKSDTVTNWTKLVAGNNKMDVAVSIKNYHEKIWFKVIDKNNNATEFGPYKTNIKSSCTTQTQQNTTTQQPTQNNTTTQQTGPVQVNTIKVSGIDTNGCKNKGVSFTVDSTGDNGASITKIEFSTDNKTWKTSNSCTIGTKKATCKINNAYSAIYYKVTTSHNHYQVFGKYCTK